MSAPVCHVPPENAGIPQPGVKNLASIPIATDLASALAAINAMRQNIQTLTNQIDWSNGFRTIPNKKDNKTQWIEQARVVDTVRVYQNNDPSTGNYVDVQQINKLVMVDKNTGQTWAWDRERK